MRRFLICIIALLYCGPFIIANTYYDIEGEELNHFLQERGARYIIRYEHRFKDTLYIPQNSELVFEGGHLCGPVVFDNTKLSGNVNLKGSSIKGHVKNKLFNASWLCAIDGTTDDAKNINEIINVCKHVVFPYGRYRLVSAYNPIGKVPQGFENSINAHVGICTSNVYLEGEEGCTFVTYNPLGTICVFSQPNRIEQSTENIQIRGITFEVHNNGRDFHEYMHTIKSIGVKGLQIDNCSFNDFWGDAICLSHYGDTPETGERTRNTDIRILNNIIVGGKHHNNRNGISVISGENVIIKRNVIKETSRKDMPGGIDIEPNNSAYTIDNIQVISNVIEGCGGTAGGICINSNGKNGPAHHIIIKNNTIQRCRAGLSFVVKSVGASNDYYISGNIIDEETIPYQFIGDGCSSNWTFKRNVFERPCKQTIPGNIKVSNLVIKDNKKKRIVPWLLERYSGFIFLSSFILSIFIIYKRKVKN